MGTDGTFTYFPFVEKAGERSVCPDFKNKILPIRADGAR